MAGYMPNVFMLKGSFKGKILLFMNHDEEPLSLLFTQLCASGNCFHTFSVAEIQKIGSEKGLEMNKKEAGNLYRIVNFMRISTQHFYGFPSGQIHSSVSPLKAAFELHYLPQIGS